MTYKPSLVDLDTPCPGEDEAPFPMVPALNNEQEPSVTVHSDVCVWRNGKQFEQRGCKGGSPYRKTRPLGAVMRFGSSLYIRIQIGIGHRRSHLKKYRSPFVSECNEGPDQDACSARTELSEQLLRLRSKQHSSLPLHPKGRPQLAKPCAIE